MVYHESNFAAVKIKLFGFLFLGLVCIDVLGQITDDSSRLVYGPTTTRIIYEADLKNNLDIEHSIDTTLSGIEYFGAYDRLGRKYQDLGNNGTALSPIFPVLPNQIGKTAGFSAYDYYFKYPDELKYYNTKSPFMDVSAVFAGQGRATVDFSYSANVNPTWNVGVDIHRITSDKQIGAETRQGDANVRNLIYDIYTYYQHPKLPYKAMFNFIGMNHDIDETGGVLVLTEDPLEFEFFQYRDSDIRLQDAFSEARYNNFHLYHEYGLFQEFQLYHQVDRYTQSNDYRDFTDASLATAFDTYGDFYNDFLLSSDTTSEQADFRSFTNEVGLKGTVSSIFYRVYLRRRDVNFRYVFLNPDRVEENYLGGLTRFSWRDFKVQGEAEFLPTGEFSLKGSLKSDLFEASYTTMRYKPSYLVDSYFGNHYEWRNSFNQAFANRLSASLNLQLGQLVFRPGAEILNLDDFYYFNQQRIASQAVGSAVVSQLGGRLNYTLFTSRERGSGFHFENEFFYTLTGGNAGDLIRVPELFYNGRHYWKGKVFQQSVPFEVGISLHAKSAYFANDYDPVTQQFHLQDSFELDSFLAADFFINMRIDKVFAFFKITHANQPANSGYFVTPLYPGQSRVFDLGVRWLFFD